MNNQMQDAPLEFYTGKYKELDPIEAAQRTQCEFDPNENRFTLKLLNFTIYASWPEFNLIPADAERCPDLLCGFQAKIIVLRYLLDGVYVQPRGKYLSYRELPWGDVYDQNFQGRCIKRLAYTFGGKLHSFEYAASALGGVPCELGDSAFDILFLADVSCRLILWNADDEFPPSSQFLFSDNTSFAWNAEDLAAVGDIIISTLKLVAARA